MKDDGERLAIAAAANVVFWSEVAEQVLGRRWPGIAASVASMTSVARGYHSPALDILNLPGNVAAQVIQQQPSRAPACACQIKKETHDE